MARSGFGRPRRHLRVAESTNQLGRELASAGAPCGTVVTANEQTTGRGRRGRTWSAPPGKALLCSAILRPLGPEHALLPLSVGLAVCEAAESIAPVECQVKWPNDIWLDGMKVGGVLIEAQPPEWAVIGVGLNLAIEPDEFPPDLRHPATSIDHGVGVEEALAGLMGALDDWVEANPGRVIQEFSARDALRGRRVEWEGAGGAVGSGAGVAAGVDERGNLVVVDDEGERHGLGSGEVQLVLGRA